MNALTSLSPRLRQRLMSAAAIVALFLLWELACVAFKVSSIVLPRPSEIFTVLFTKLPLMWPHATQTLYTTLLGFALGTLAGVLIGAVIGMSRVAYDVAYPILVGFSSIPKVAVVPIFVVWFGAGTVPAVLTSMVICMFPVVVNIATGLAHTEPELQDVLKVLGARKLDILWNVGLPRTLPYLFASLKIALTLAFVGTVLAETIAANKGIGNMMMIASGNFDVPLVFAGLFILAAMGVALYVASALIERRFTGWAQRGNELPNG
ncbi:MAG: ABC transporter permease [Candidatus Dactylopiibacterium carminicum]|uniref:ABC transporter permease n=1 Tax=Candidatus Dactylopiibacterium carminicum TaxID=857335 RepID=A0A272ERP6_9RHOO|nr:ABC transporter permease [Candidatus Dactylopiibacterium carminicum]KAF7598865.1 ABC transporter permease [Candidatus Dactylopiibacterium carminicum]PAS92781.1 MAG: ABC transporter permease [Candidatus Dactylopiibacterium carminicum]PAS96230.1 MAG: ABC transporter permease [Candidatus Dactylopiibacterium carminicum]PAS98882.1 MAG: ABC transporter permease [Candidatus Dactylopiibacterium carminicum]